MSAMLHSLLKPTISKKSGAAISSLIILGIIWLADDAYLGHDITSAFKATEAVWEIRAMAHEIGYQALRAQRGGQNNTGVLSEMAKDFDGKLTQLRRIRFRLVDANTLSLVRLAEQELDYRWRLYRQLLMRLQGKAALGTEAPMLLSNLEAANEGIVATTEAVVKQVEATSAYAKNRAAQIRMVTVSTGFILLGILTIALHLKVVRPVRLTVKQAKRFTDGDFSARIDFSSHDEIGELVKTLNYSADCISWLLEATAIQANISEQDANMFQTILESVPDSILIADAKGTISIVNAQAEMMFLCTREELYSTTVDMLISKYDYSKELEVYGQNQYGIHAGDLGNYAYASRKDGKRIPVEIAESNYEHSGKKFTITILRDITQRLAMEEAMRLRESAITCSANGVVIVDALRARLPIVYVNPAFEKMTGYCSGEVQGRSPGFLHGRDRDQPSLAKIRDALRNKCPVRALVRNYRKDGSLFWNDLQISPITDQSGRITHYVGHVYDVSDRVAYKQALEYQETHDTLTGAFNLYMVNIVLAEEIDNARRNGRVIAVLCLDLDNFKIINESMGHNIGDTLLKHVSERLLRVVREVDILARQGGDEFIVILCDIQREEDVWPVAKNIHSSMALPMFLNNHEVRVTASMGISLYPRDGEDPNTLLMNADSAMYKGKAEGKNKIQYFNREMYRMAKHRMSVEAALRRAIDQHEFMLYYQPKVNLYTGKIVGLEALLRWVTTGGEVYTPAEFIPVLEDTGLIVPVGQWVLKTACEQAIKWFNNKKTAVHIAVNLSARQLYEPNFEKSLFSVLEETGLDPELLELELTESMLLPDVEQMLNEISKKGVSFSIDDFGTGYSNLSHLERFPIKRLKIDRVFIQGLTTSHRHSTIVDAVIAIGNGLDVNVCAEGVEYKEQAMELLARGCVEAQGYHFSKALPADEATRILDKEFFIYEPVT